MKASLQLSSQSHRSSRLATFVFQCALLLSLLIPAGRVWGQSTVEWGNASDNNGTTSYSYSPYGRHYGWEYKVYCYRPSTLPFSGTITQMAFLAATTENTAGTNTSSSITINGVSDNNPMQIWMKEVSGDYSLSSSEYFSTYVSGATKVYSGNIPTTTSGSYNTFTLTIPFVHSQENSLLILVRTVANSTSGCSAHECYYKSTGDGAVVTWYNKKDSSDPGISSLATAYGTTAGQLPVLRLTYTGDGGSQGGDDGCENFENVTGVNSGGTAGSLPTDWSYIYTGTSTGYIPKVYNSTSYKPSDSELAAAIGSNRLMLIASSSSSYGSDAYAILPPSDNITAISFNAWRENASYGTLYFGYITDANNASTFTTIEALSTVAYGSATLSNASFSFSNLSIPSGARLAFKWNQTGTSTWYSAFVDNICITYDACIASSFPIFYGFETSEGFPSNASTPTTNRFDDCWRNEATVQNGTNSTRVWGTSTSYKHTGSQALILPDKGNSTNYAKTMLVFPPMNFTSTNGYIVSFWIYRSGSNSKPEGFKVYVSDVDTIGPNAIELGHYSRNYTIAYPQIESTSGWYQYETTPIRMTGRAYLIFEGQSYYGSATYVDDITIDVAPSCYKPTALTLVSVTTTTATLSWTPGGSESSWQYSINNGETWQNFASTPTGTTTKTGTISGLTAATTYNVKVRANCGNSDYSDASTTVTLVTDCNPITSFPWEENFDNYTGTTSGANNNLPSCWRYYNGSTYSSYAGYPVVYGSSSSDSHSGSNYLRFYSYYSSSYTYTPLYAILPPMADISSLQVELYARAYSTSYNATFSVGVMEGSDPNTFVQIAEFTPSTTTYQLYTIPLNSYTGNGNRIAIKMQPGMSGATYRSVYIDDITVDVIPACPKPTDLAISNINTNSATITWEGNADSYHVKYRSPEHIDGVEENFNTTNIPNGWTKYSGLLSSVLDNTASLTSTTSGWYFGANNGVFDSHARLNIYSNYQYWLVSPNIEIPQGSAIAFDLALTAYSGTVATPSTTGTDDKFVVLISTDNGDTWNILRQWDNAGSDYVYNEIACSSTGQHVTVDLSNYANQNIKIAFYGESTTSNADNNLHIDNVSIGLPISATSWQTVSTTDNTATLNLDPETPYEVCVQAVCDENESEWTNTISFTTLCDLITTFPWEENFDNYTGTTSGNANNLPGCWGYYNGSTYSSNAGYPVVYGSSSSDSHSGSNYLRFYSYYSSSYTYTPLYAILPPMADISSLQVELYARANSTSYNATFSVGVMEGSDPNTFVQIAEYTPSTTTYQQYIIPLNSYTGNGNRIVIKMEPGMSGTTYRSVYIDDITVDVIPACPKPTDLAAVTEDQSATISWTSDAANWTIQYGSDNTFAAGTYIQTTANGSPAKELTNLTQNTTYYARVKANCNSNAESDWSLTLTFTTKQTPVIVGNGWSDNFEGTENNWVLANENTNSWTIGTATQNGGNQSLYISNNGGTTNAYTNNTIQIDYATKLFTFDDSQYVFTYDWKAYGEENYDYLRVWLAPASATFTAGQFPDGTNTTYNYRTTTPDGWLSLDNGGKLNLQSSWQTHESIESISAGNYYLVFLWANDGSSGSNPPAAIDNVSIALPAIITVTANPTSDGTVSGGGSYAVGSEATIIAMPNTNYHFVNWTENGNVVSTNDSYTFTVDGNHNFVANFEIDSYGITTTANPTTGGTITGAGTYSHGATVTLTATANAGYTFVNWTKDGEEVSTNATHTFTATEAAAYTANFTCIAATNPIVSNITSTEATLTWNGSGSIYNVQMGTPIFTTTIQNVQEINEGFENVSLPNGWTKEGPGIWTIATGNHSSGSIDDAHTGDYNAQITHHNRDEQTYLITPEMDLSTATSATLSLWYTNEEWPSDIDGFGIYYRVNNGDWNELFFTDEEHASWTEISDLHLTGLDAHYQIGFLFLDNYGYGVTIDDIVINSVKQVPVIDHYEWTTIASNVASPYNFTDLTPGTTYQTRVSDECDDASAIVEFTTLNEYTVNVSANPSTYGTVTGSGNYLEGDNVTITATPGTDCEFAGWSENGSIISTNASYTINNISDNHTLIANFRKNFTVTASADPTEGGHVEILTGDGGTSTDQNLPCYTYYNYNLTQQIYTPAEIGNVSTINSIAFYNDGSTKTISELEFYMAHTYKSQFEDTDDWISVTAGDQVYAGTNVELTAGKWTIIDLTTPFEYDGVSNLVLITNEYMDYSNGLKCRVFTPASGGNCAIYSYNDDDSYDVTSPSSIEYYDVLTVKNQILINPGSDLTRSFPEGSSVTLMEEPNEHYHFVEWTDNNSTAGSNTTYTINNLSANHSVVANFELNSHDVTYEYTGTVPTGAPDVPATQTYNYGATVPAAAVPTLEGYTFSGWDGEVTTMPDEDVNVTGYWTINTHTLTINYQYSDNTQAADSHIETVNYGDSYSVTSPDITGYTPNQAVVSGTMPDDDVTVNVTYTANSYEITASANPTAGGTITGAGTYNYGATVTLTATANASYTFVNWTKDGEEVSTNASYSFTATEAASYIANFERNTMTLTAVGGTLTYDGQAHTATVTPEVTEGTTLYYRITPNDQWSTTVPSITNVGTLHVYVKATNANYADSEADCILEVTPKAATIAANNANKVYGDEDPDLTAEVSGTVGNETLTYTLSRAEGENVGTYAITVTASADDNPNYSITTSNGTFTITPATVTVTAENKSKTYGDADPDLTWTAEGFQNDDNEDVLTVTINRAEGETVGTYAITPSGDAVQGNYNVVYATGTFTIDRAKVTVTADDTEKTYGAADPEFTWTAEGLRNNDTEEVLTVSITRTEGETVGTYTITPSGDATQGNYTVEYETGTFTINAKTATIAANNNSKTYGEEDPDLTANVTGVMEGDELTYTVSREEGESVGTYTITVTVSADANPNYSITTSNGTFTITPKAATIAANNTNKVYGAQDPDLTAEVSGTVGNDALTYTLSRAEGENVGTYAITVTASADDNPNYSITTTNGTFTITPATVTVTAENKSKTYGDADPDLTWTAEGFQNDDDEDVLTVSISRAEGEAVGDYTITPSGATTQGNYNVVYTTGTFTINHAKVTVTAEDKSKTYGAADPELTWTAEGLQNNDTEDVLTVSITRTEGETVGTYTITPSGDATQGNYTVEYETGTFTINAKTATIAANDNSKTYGDDDPDLTANVTGVMEGDELNYTLSREEGESVGTYTISVVLGDNPNYSITTSNGTFTINPKAATIAANNNSKTYGDDDPTLTAEVSGIVGNDALTYELEREEGEDVGTYTINVVVSADANPNYSITTSTGIFTISPKAATIAANNNEKTYGDDDPDLTATINGLVGTDELDYELEREEGEDVGTYTISVVLGDNPNYSITTSTGTFTINRATATVTAVDNSKVYGTAEPELTANVTGLQNNDDASVISYTISRAEGETVGEYAITPSGDAVQGNYNVEYETGTFTITPASVTVTIVGNHSIVDYDGEEHEVSGYEVTSIMIGNNETELYSEDDFTHSGDAMVSRTDAGTSNMGLSADDFENTNTNFEGVTFNVTDGYITISPISAVVTITGRVATVTYDGTEHTVTGYTATVNTDLYDVEEDIEFSDEATASQTIVGTNYMGLTAEQFENTNENFEEVTFNIVTDGHITVNPAAITIIADENGKVYGAAEPTTLTATVEGVPESGVDPVYTVSRAEGEDVGEYAITITPGSNPNYTITTVNGVFTIMPATVTVTAENKSKTYGDADPDLTWTAEGFQNNDNEEMLTVSITRAEGNYVGDYTITPSGDAVQGNYNVVYETGTFSILPTVLFTTAPMPTSICSEGSISVAFDATIAGDNGEMTFAWSRNHTDDVTGTAEGTGDIEDLTLTTTATQTVTFSVIPTFTPTEGEDVTGEAVTFNVVVNALPAVTAAHTNVSCDALGSATLTVTNGDAPLTCLWNNETFEFTADGDNYFVTFNGLTGGEYPYVITNTNSCTTSGTITVEDPGRMSVSQSANSETCENTGITVNYEIEGGTEPYTLTWMNADNETPVEGTEASTLTGSHTFTLPQGEYRLALVITDTYGCSSTSDDILEVTVWPNRVIEREITVVGGDTYEHNGVIYTYPAVPDDETEPGEHGCESTIHYVVNQYTLGISIADNCTLTRSSYTRAYSNTPHTLYGDTIYVRKNSPATFYAYINDTEETMWNDEKMDMSYELLFNESEISEGDLPSLVSNFSISSYYDRTGQYYGISNLTAAAGEIPNNTLAFRQTANSTILHFDYFYFAAFKNVPNKVTLTGLENGTYTLKLKAELRHSTGGTNRNGIYNPYIVGRKYGHLWGGYGDRPGDKEVIAARTFTIIVNENGTNPNGAPMAVNEYAEEASVSTFPNPVNDQLNIRISGMSGATVITITDAQGKVVRNINTELYGGEEVLTYSVAGFAQGIYFLNVRNSDSVVAQKFIVTKR